MDKDDEDGINAIKSLVKRSRSGDGEGIEKTEMVTGACRSGRRRCDHGRNAETKIREYYTCILFLRLDYEDVFGKNMLLFGDAANGVHLSNSELYVKRSVELLLSVYRSNYYNEKVNAYDPKIYTLFECSGRIDVGKLFGNGGVNLAREANIDIGLHISLTRNTRLNRRMCAIILKEVINEFGGKALLSLPGSHDAVPVDANKLDLYDSRSVVINTSLKPFGLYLDMDNIYIYENHSLSAGSPRKGAKINGGLYSGVKLDSCTRKMYVDPILSRIDGVLSKYGLEKYFEYDTCHVTLFYIKRKDL
ncbi:hypothetical protein FG386_000246 [Cryptosporidium ryanae]|uniref:uncharacterized protein n=1 Tax=Cryptosporidium ryanae TaxID=515981 RepID=UPI00351A29A7|nr:hypothetical protein FG386_000246 [Cryptosporidium ryanae]